MTLAAQSRGWCSAGIDQIFEGDLIVSYADGWAHPGCVVSADRAMVAREMCQNCFTEKSVSGACLC